MAMFHFRLKSDKKPDSTKISAVHHVDYIRREGTFAYIDFNLNFGGNAITSAEKSDALGGRDSLLYHSDNFGSIKNSANGIELTENASPTTIAVDLILADESLNHQPLILRDSSNRKEIIHNERQSFIDNGGLVVSKRHFPKSHTSVTNAKSIETASKIGLCLPSLSQLNLVHSESQGTDLLLQNDESRQLEQLSKKCCDHVRWDFSSEWKQLAERTAKKILSNIESHMDQVFASSHVEYINREKAFEQRGGCIFHSHKLPKWANDDPKKFFKAADKYEGKGNRRYMEIEFALPNELTTIEQYRQIIDAFIDKHLKDHYFAYAIHDKIGALSNGQHHPHVHIVFSERFIDDVEKIKERDACNFFKYPARKKKDGSEPTFAEKV